MATVYYCDEFEARAANGRWQQLSSYTESEITSLVPRAPSRFLSFAVRSASEEKLGGSQETRLLIQYLM